MNNLIVEVKLRFSNELMRWEDRSIHTSFEVVSGNGGYFVALLGGHKVRLYEAVKNIAKEAGAVESRWNFQNQDQGHYNFS